MGLGACHCVGKRLTALDNRLFENWWVWKEFAMNAGRIAYMVGFVPLSEYSGEKFEGKENPKLNTLEKGRK